MGPRWDSVGSWWEYSGSVVGVRCYHHGRIMGGPWEGDGRINEACMYYVGGNQS
ncbi:MAG: hypothetical protein H7X99_07760 [Saprospiraceae bacterium]|nr:hypothetical protein [Saprospiraceae bacterium]